MKCDTCLRSRAVISENGWHYVCALAERTAVRCLSEEKDMYLGLKRSDDHASLQG